MTGQDDMMAVPCTTPSSHLSDKYSDMGKGLMVLNFRLFPVVPDKPGQHTAYFQVLWKHCSLS